MFTVPQDPQPPSWALDYTPAEFSIKPLPCPIVLWKWLLGMPLKVPSLILAYTGTDLLNTGINSVRGTAADTMGRLILAKADIPNIF